MEAPSELRSLQSSVFSRGFPGTVVEAPFGRRPIMWRGATDYLLKGRVIALCHDMLLFASSIVCLEHRGRFARPPRSGRDRESGAPQGGLLLTYRGLLTCVHMVHVFGITCYLG